jgi:hypothetical protein
MAKDLASHVDKMAAKYGVPVSHARAIFQIESSGGKNKAVSKAGARGPMQLMPATAKELGVNIDDPFQNIEGGVKYYAKMLKQFGDPILAVAAYNAGPRNVREAGGVPKFKETQNYVRKFTSLVGAPNLMDAVAPKVARSAPGKPLSMKLDEPKPYTPEPVDVEQETESNFASLLAKIGMGGKKRKSAKKTPGILDGLF